MVVITYCVIQFLLLCDLDIVVSRSVFFFSSRRRHTRCALVTGVQTCALPISHAGDILGTDRVPATVLVANESASLRHVFLIAHVSILRLEVDGRKLAKVPRKRKGLVNFSCEIRSEEHTSELQSLMRNSYAVFCIQNKKHKTKKTTTKNIDTNKRLTTQTTATH